MQDTNELTVAPQGADADATEDVEDAAYRTSLRLDWGSCFWPSSSRGQD